MRFTRYVAPLAVALSALSAPALASDTAAIMVFDASGSMWNRIEGDITRIEVARDVMEEFFSNRDATTPISVIAYGHTRRGDCGDIEVIAPLGLHDAADLTQRIRRLNPQGMTPLTDSLILARQQIPPTAESADIILVTDGLETCGGDPCAAAADIAAEGISIRAHVVAFGMTEEQTNTLACIPEQTGGMLFNTNSGAELAEAMTAVETREPVEPEPEPEAMVEPEPEVIEAATAIMGPDSVRMGERFTINWSETIDERDFVAIVPVGSDAGTLGTSARVRTGSSAELRAPAAPGLYELRYVQNDGRATLASAPIEVTIAETSISGPDSVRMGERFTINWSDNIDSRDFVAIVPAGADEGTLGTSNRVRSSSSTELRAPSEPGMYELRYVLDEGRVTLASAAIEVTGATASISGPDSVRMGERFTINWSDNIDSRDFVAIVPVGADEGTLGTSTRVRSSTSAELRAPSEPGMYELRYILDEGRSTLASAPIEVTGAETSISGPDSVRMGERFTINWSDNIDSRDFVAIVPMGADEGTLGTSTRVRSDSSAELRAPSEPGLYELRYILDEGRSTLASAPIEVTAASVEITGPDEVRAGDRLRISWSETIDSRDLIAIVPMGADEGTLGDSTRTRSSNTEHDFTAPEQPGLYEARYVLDEGRGTLASHSFEVLPETAPLDAGAGLEAPERATPGEEVRVTWTAPAADVDRRIVLARTDQPLFSWIEAQPVGDRSETVFTMPSSAGFYEFRLLDISEQAVMGRSVIEVR